MLNIDNNINSVAKQNNVDILQDHSLLSSNTNLSVFHINIRSLRNKIDQLSLFLDKFNFNILCLSEHWLSDLYLDTVKIQDYQLISNFSRNVSNHGGVAIFARKSFKCKQISVSSFCTELCAEFCALETFSTFLGYKIVIICAYRSPIGDFSIFLQQLEKLLDFCFDISHHLIVMGDFNVNFNNNSTNLSDLISLVSSYGLEPCIEKHTRITSNSATCIDNILTNLNTKAVTTGTLDPCLSDHCGIYLSINAQITCNKNSPTKFRQFSMTNIEKFKQELLLINWTIFTPSSNYDSNYLAAFLVNTYRSLIDKIFPFQIKKNTDTSPFNWLDNNLRSMRDNLSSIKLICDVTGNYSLYNAFKKQYECQINKKKDCLRQFPSEL